jgi:hypothetical protein
MGDTRKCNLILKQTAFFLLIICCSLVEAAPPPRVVDATSSTGNGYYKEGDSINIHIDFSEAISSTGLTINLSSGSSLSTGPLSSATGWSGTYTVGAGENTPTSPLAALNISEIVGTIASDASSKSTTDPTIPTGQNMHTSTIYIDTSAPTLNELAPVPTPTNNQNPEYSFSSDETGTIGFGGACSSITTSAAVGNNTVTLTPSGGGTFADGTYGDCAIVVTDLAGNASALLAVSSFTIDTIPPVTSDNAPSLWQTADFTVTLVCSDGTGSGCSQTKYTVDGSGELTGTSVLIATDGDHTLSYYSIDNATNQGTPKTVHAMLDKTAPQVSSVAPTGTTNNAYPTISADFSDSGTGIDVVSASLSLDGQTLSNCVTTASHISCFSSHLLSGLQSIAVRFLTTPVTQARSAAALPSFICRSGSQVRLQHIIPSFRMRLLRQMTETPLRSRRAIFQRPSSTSIKAAQQLPFRAVTTPDIREMPAQRG